MSLVAKWRHDAAVAVDPPAHRPAQEARDEHGRIGGAVVPRVVAHAAPNLEAVAEPARSGTPTFAPLPSSSVLVAMVEPCTNSVVAAAAVRARRATEPERPRSSASNTPCAGSDGTRGNLETRRRRRVREDEVGERAADIDADAPGGSDIGLHAARFRAVASCWRDGATASRPRLHGERWPDARRRSGSSGAADTAGTPSLICLAAAITARGTLLVPRGIDPVARRRYAERGDDASSMAKIGAATPPMSGLNVPSVCA